uniref:Restriction modification enzyme subunit S1A n=2 Tax=Mycoplasmopsis pulmonis TaxID=2107 RepID=Q50356_MYCPL|nr:restriction modification enzyme subunit S1A [Mycoplasmopsis pulmonis]AAC78314.1 restriction-modification enzyme MpuUI S subunit [Mycoplasmopsis pulmonis]
MEIYKLGQILNLEKGKSKYNAKYVSQNIGIYNLYSSKTKDQGIFGKINSYDFNGEYILITTHGAYAGTVKYVNEKFSTTSNCFILKVNENIVKTKFLSYLLLLQEKTFNDMAIGSAYGYLKNYNINDFEVNLPNLKIQSAIIKIIEPKEDLFFRHKNLVRIDSEENTKKDLSILIKIIEPLEKQINAFDELILSEQKSLQHYLNYFLNKLASINPSIFKNYKLGEIAKILSGKTPSTAKKELWKKEIPFFGPGDLDNMVPKRFITFNEKMIKRSGTILFSSAATIGKVGILDNLSWFNQQITSIEANNNYVMDKFLFFLLKKISSKIKFENSSGTIFPTIKKKYFENFTLEIPNLKTQSAILGIIEPLHKKINLLKQKKKLLEKRFIYYQNHLIKEKIKDE